jgi:localization factor PodJL
MTSGGPWNLRGLRPEARAAAREAARRSGLSVGEWLNSLIPRAERHESEEDDDSWWSGNEDGVADDRPAPRSRSSGEGRGRHRHRHKRRWHGRGRENEPPQKFEQQPFEETAPRPPSRRRGFDDDDRDEGAPRGRDDDRWQDGHQDGHEDDRRGRSRAASRRSRSDVEDRGRSEDRAPAWQQYAPPRDFPTGQRAFASYRDEPARPRVREPEDQYLLSVRHEGRERAAPSRRAEQQRYERRNGEGQPLERGSPPRPDRPDRPDRAVLDPYREAGAADAGGWERYALAAALPVEEEPDHEVMIDQAVAEITARQRVLDADADAQAPMRPFVSPPPPPPAPPTAPPSAVAAPLPLPRAFPASPEKVRFDWKNWDWRGANPPGKSAPEPAIDLSNLEQQLRQITAKIEALRPSGELETALDALRAELAQIGRSLTEALPRRAVESLETEVKALAARIDDTRQNGGAPTALAGIERGLGEVREALRALTPAEGLIGFDETVKALHEKVDALAKKDDPAAVQQLEMAIGTLRGIVAHVASSDALAKVADDVRALTAKVDVVTAGAASMPALAALEKRLDSLTGALTASTEAGQAVPRELERLFTGLIEKLEAVQLTQTDHSALAHLEDRIAALVKRLDASDARFGMLEGVERGLADLLVYVEQLRGANVANGGVGKAVAAETAAPKLMETKPVETTPAATKPAEIKPVEIKPAETKLPERRGQGGVPADARGDIVVERAADRLPALAAAAPRSAAPAFAQTLADVALPVDPPRQVAAAAASSGRKPIDPNLPPDHPLEPGAKGRNGGASSAERIAASKPPVIADPSGGKADFIAAARRAARAAAEAPEKKSRDVIAPASPDAAKKLSGRARPFIVAAAVIAIVVGGFHIVSHLFQGGSGGSGATAQLPAAAPRTQPVPQGMTEPPQPQTLPEPVQPAPQAGPPHAQMQEPLPPATLGASGASASQPLILPVPQEAAQSSTPPAASAQPSLPSLPSLPAPAALPPALPSGQESTLPAPPPGGITTGVGAPLDITGALPRVSGATLPPPRPAAGTPRDGLPLGIGGPALRLAALAGDPAAAYEVAVRFAEGRGIPASNEEAARWFEIAAKAGLAPAQFRLGGLYEKGLGVRKDFATARDLYRAAADKGHGKAMHNLAVLYAEGIDGKADYRTAAQWFRKAADRGISDSQYNLAVLYARGVGVEQNFAEAYKWFFLAARDGDHDAAQKRDEIASRLDQGALAAARASAEKWTPLAQPADVVNVRANWDAPAGSAPSAQSPKPKPHAANAAAGGNPIKPAAADVVKVN